MDFLCQIEILHVKSKHVEIIKNSRFFSDLFEIPGISKFFFA